MTANPPAVLSQFQPIYVGAGGQKTAPRPRRELVDAFLEATANKRARLSYDAARDTDEFKNYWANSDALDADSANSRAVRHKLIRRSRYEYGSNGFYAGIIDTHVNMVVGVGPKLRMLTTNRGFNQVVEREFGKWCQRVDFRRKLWCMAHARALDGETFAILQTNPAISGPVQLDFTLIEAEQVQTPYIPAGIPGYIDGIRFDVASDNILHYDVLKSHPGNTNQIPLNIQPIQVSPREMVHWFKMDRPGQHRGIPALTSTLNVGAACRRWREATIAAAETAADFTMFLKSTMSPEEVENAGVPFSTFGIQKRLFTALPDGYDAFQPKAEQPTANHGEFLRTLLCEMGRPLHMPYNLTACDSSTYSFASGKLDTQCKNSSIDIERADCDSQVCDRLFEEWFSEWSITANDFEDMPDHQWDWPAHEVVDEVADANATDTRLKNGSLTHREDSSRRGDDYEDSLSVMAEDTFGEATDENIEKMRQIQLLRNTSKDALPYVAQLLGISMPAPVQQPNTQPQEQAA